VSSRKEGDSVRKGSSLFEYEVKRGATALWKYGHEFTPEEQRFLLEKNPRFLGDMNTFAETRWFTRFNGKLDRRMWRPLSPHAHERSTWCCVNGQWRLRPV
jgi:hypothetical protein